MKASMFGTTAVLVSFAAGMVFMASCGGGGERAMAQTKPTQLFCQGPAVDNNTWTMNSTSATCTLSTDGSIMTFAQILAEGWTATIAAFPTGVLFMVFNK